MALINCIECNGKLSDMADSCPHCGAPAHLSHANNVKTKQCFECQTEITEGLDICPNCGVSQSLNPILNSKSDESTRNEGNRESNQSEMNNKTITEKHVVYIQENKKKRPFATFLKWVGIVLLILILSIVVYDYYMRNSGFSNRIKYEIQKNDFRDRSYDSPAEKFEKWNEDRKERREERRRRRQEFWNN